MANQLTAQQLEDINKILGETEHILQTQVVFVRNDPQNHQYINMAVQRPQLLRLGHDRFPVHPKSVKGGPTFVSFGNHWVLRGQRINYDGLDRTMVQTSFAGYIGTGKYGAMFALILEGMSGPQAQMIAGANGAQQQQNLYVLDVETALVLRNQCVSWGDNQSLTYQLVRAAYGLLALANALNRFIDQDVNQQVIEDLRTQIHRLGSIYAQQLQSATMAEYIFKVAIVRTENMPALVPQIWPVAQPLLMQVPDYGPVPPFDPNNINIDNLNNDWCDFAYPLVINSMYSTNWAQIFGQYANCGNSVAFMNVTDDSPAEQRILYLPNDQIIAISVERKTDGTYLLKSKNFIDSYNHIYRLRQVPNWPAWVADKNHNNSLYLPLHSHGLAGSHTEDLDLISGNNGCQVMSLQFGHPLNDQRIYFINRHMALRLRQLFETHQIMVVYQSWFDHLLPLSRRICDARRLSRQVHNDADQLLLKASKHLCNRLIIISNRLIANYHWLVRLEQIWKYSVLAPNINAPVVANREEPPIPIFVNPGAYCLGAGAKLQSVWPEDQGKGKGAQEEQQQ